MSVVVIVFLAAGLGDSTVRVRLSLGRCTPRDESIRSGPQ